MATYWHSHSNEKEQEEKPMLTHSEMELGDSSSTEATSPDSKFSLSFQSNENKDVQLHGVLHSLFEHQAYLAPHNVALEHGAEQLTYAQLEEQANRMAFTLTTRARVGVGSRVCFQMQKSSSMYVLILAILKSGASYVALDVSYPAERVEYILRDCGAKLFVVDKDFIPSAKRIANNFNSQETRHCLSELGATLPLSNESSAISETIKPPPPLKNDSITMSFPQVPISTLSEGEISTASLTLQVLDIEELLIECEIKKGLHWRVADHSFPQPQDEAYVIYTSGTTGTPKGVSVRHSNVFQLVNAEQAVYNIKSQDRVLQGFSVAFDASIEEIWPAWSAGATVVVGGHDIMHLGPDLASKLEELNITVFSCVPTLLTVVRPVDTVRILISGGEALSPDVVEPWFSPHRQIFNTYGPTETTVVATYSLCRSGAEISIGGPLPNYTVYVLSYENDRKELLPLGQEGELVIGGPGVTNGYLNRPLQTAEHFIENMFSNVTGDFSKTLYRTGDLVRMNAADRSLTYLGRIDTQVKVRGYRVELGEVEAAVRQLSGAKNCVVLQRTLSDGISVLIAYLEVSGHEDQGKSSEGCIETPGLSTCQTASLPISTKAIPLPLAPQILSLNSNHSKYSSSKLIFNEKSLIRDLQQRLPPYMVPFTFVELDTFPTLPSSGKIDRKSAKFITPSIVTRMQENINSTHNIDESFPRSLKDTTGNNPATSFGSSSATTEDLDTKETRAIKEIWAQLFHYEPSSLSESIDFFRDLGGHSMLAAQFVARLRSDKSRLYSSISMADVYNYSTLGRLASRLETLERQQGQDTQINGGTTKVYQHRASSTTHPTKPLHLLTAVQKESSGEKEFGCSSAHILATPSLTCGPRSEEEQILCAQHQESTVGDEACCSGIVELETKVECAGTSHCMSFNEHTSAAQLRFLLGSAVQILFLMVYMTVIVLQWTLPFLMYLDFRDFYSVGISLALTLLISIMTILIDLAISLSLYWLLLRNIQEGDYPQWGSVHMRVWIVDTSTRVLQIWFDFFRCTAFLPGLLSLYGCNIGKNVVINTNLANCYHFLDVGDNTVINFNTSITTSTVEKGIFRLRRVVIGRHVDIGARCSISPGATLGDLVVLEPLTGISAGATVGSGERWGGAPGNFLGHTYDSSSGLQADISLVQVDVVREAAGVNVSLQRPMEDKDDSPLFTSSMETERESLIHTPATVIPQGLHSDLGASSLPLTQSTVLPTWLILLVQMVVIACLPTIMMAPTFPGLAVLLNLTNSAVIWVALSPIVAGSYVVCSALFTLAIKWVLIGRVHEGLFHLNSAYFLRLWILERLMTFSLAWTRTLYATLYVVPWLRALGMKIGKASEISTATILFPDLISLGDGCFIADSATLAVPIIKANQVIIKGISIGDRSFIGNAAYIPCGSTIGSNCLIGVMGYPPDIKTPSNTSWIGSPPVLLPHRQAARKTFDVRYTFNPTLGLKMQRLTVEFFRVLSPSWMLTAGVLSIVAAFEAILYLPTLDSSYRYAIAFGCFAFLVLFIMAVVVLCFAALKYLLIGTYVTDEYPLWSCFVWRTELITGVYESFLVPFICNMLRGTVLLPMVLRILGADIGRRVYLNTADFSEFDLIEMHDDTVVNSGTIVQTHLFEDRVMKTGSIEFGPGSCLGSSSVILYGSKLEDGTHIGELSLVMKGELVPSGTSWEGMPLQRMH